MNEHSLASKPLKKQTMADQMAAAITQSILNEEIAAGESLPTEPELAKQFGVSRAVIRDATRILMARGLVDVQQGRGVFVTHPQNAAFGNALLLALKRDKATVWDIEQFDQVLFPEIIALAIENITDEELALLQEKGEICLQQIEEYQTKWWRKKPPAKAQAQYKSTFDAFLYVIYQATHNKVIQQIAFPLLNLKNLRNWEDDHTDVSIEKFIELESRYITGLIDLIKSGNPKKARALVKEQMVLPDKAIDAMKDYQIGEIPELQLPFDGLFPEI